MGAMQLLPGLRYNEKSPGARGTSYLFLASLALAAVRGIKVSSTLFDLIYSTFTIPPHCPWSLYSTFMYFIQHCFICRPSDSTVTEDAGIEPRIVATAALPVTRPNHSATSHPHLSFYRLARLRSPFYLLYCCPFICCFLILFVIYTIFIPFTGVFPFVISVFLKILFFTSFYP